MKKRIHDSLGKAARRRKQIQMVLGDVDPSTTTTDVALGLSGSSARLKTYSEQRKPLAVATNTAATLLTANVAYRNALLHRGDVVENPAQVELRKSIEVAESKDAAREAFLLVAHSAPDLISSQSIRSLCQTLLKLDVQSRMGTAAYHTALADVSGSGEDRWSAVKPEEEATFLRYQTRQLERYATHGSSRSPELEWLSEGADNNTVAVLNHQLQRHAERSVPISSEVWMDLMRLDISWSSALRIFDRVRSQDAGVLPPVEMSTRVMALMTGYKTNGLGSRPWKEALRMYHDVLQSGYDVEVRTHTAALDALWRSADNFVQPHRSVSEAHKEMIASSIKEIRQRCEVEERKRIAGEDGCAYVEGLVKAMSAAGQWQAAMEVLSSTDLAATDASFRMLVPTPESYAFVMAACHVQGHAAHAIALREIFNASGWTLRSLHPEVLQVYLQSLRNVVRRIPSIGKDVEELIGDGYGLDRPCSIACLQLLSSIFVETKQPKEEVAEKVVRQFLEKNVWLQQPLARKVELQTVFRCMFLISTARSRGGSAAPSSLAYLETYLSDVFGPSSPELEWFRDAEIYGLRCTRDWKYALDLFHRIVECRPPSHLKYLPIPLRQAKVELLATLLACSKGRSASGEEQEFLLDDEAFDAYTRESEEVAAIGVQRASDLFDWEEVVPHAMVGELVLEQADSMRSEEDGVDGEASQQSKRALALTAMRHFAFAPSHDLSPGMYRMLGRFLGLAETHVESTMVEGHARLLGNVLRTLDSGRTVGKAAPLEAYLC